MSKFTSYPRGVRTAVLATLAIVLPALVAARLRADDEKKPDGEEKPSQLAKDLVGTWVLAGTPEKPEDPPKSGGRLKFLTGKHWCVSHSDPVSGKVIFHLGGTYSLDGDEMANTIDYANEGAASYIGKTHKFKIKVEGDTFIQIGLDNQYTERWKRLK